MSQLIGLVGLVARLFTFIVIIRCVMSFVRPNPHNPFVRIIYRVTDPLMDAIRRAFPFLVVGGIDLTPIVIIFLVQLSAEYVIQLLSWLAMLSAGSPVG